MGENSKMHLGWRLFWGVVGAGLTFTVLSVTEVVLPLPVMIAVVIAAGVVVAVGGPMLLDLLNLV